MKNIKIIIEQANVADVPEIFDMKLEAWISTYATHGVTEEDVRKRIEPGREIQYKNFEKMIMENNNMGTKFPLGILVVKIKEKIVALATPMKSDGQNRVGSLYILQEYQSMGIGSKLMQKIIDTFNGEDIYLHVQSENEKAIKFYEKWGFVKTRNLADEYFDKEKTKVLHQFEMKRKAG